MKTSSKRGPQIIGRIVKTEVFLRAVAAKIRARAEAHNLQHPKAEDSAAGAKLRDLSAAVDRIANELRAPELPFSS